MKVSINVLRDVDKEYIPFNFPAYWNNEGYCYLRVQSKNQKIVFTCAQLYDYNNTSITNASEAIQNQAIRLLLNEGVIQVDKHAQLSDILKGSDRKFDEVNYAILSWFNEHAVWLQYYPDTLSINL